MLNQDKNTLEVIFKSDNYIKILDNSDESPFIIHLIKSGYKNLWFRLFENAYETEPWQSGVSFLNREKILEYYNIEL